MNQYADFNKDIKAVICQNIKKYRNEKGVRLMDLYAYMHDIFGANVIELFDMKYKQEHEIKE